MTPWLNFSIMILSTIGMFITYLISVQPARLEQRISLKAYRICGIFRLLSMFFMGVITLNYILYRYYPIPIDPFPISFPWPYWVSVGIALVIAIPGGSLMFWAMKDAGTETMFPNKNHTLYKGIYETIRHPMALGELPLWWSIAFLVHSPFLVVYSLIHVPVFMYWSFAEEKDLLLRYGESYQAYRDKTGMFFPKKQG